MRPPLSCSLSFKRASTARFMSRCKRRPKSRNMVEPPESTMFWQASKHKINKSQMLKVAEMVDTYKTNI